jgi:hypothetical protein
VRRTIPRQDNSEPTKVIEDKAKPEAKKFTVYRGEGRQGIENLRGMDSYGKGKYYSLNEKYASIYGTVKESEIELQKPLEIRSQDGLTKIAMQMAEDGYTDLGKWARDKGYDSIIDYETEIINKL